MSDRISLNKLQYEAVPFFKQRPFINPDKAVVKHEMPFKENYRDRFTIGSNGDTAAYSHDFYNSLNRLNINRMLG
ncbi:hypothetical protein ISS30_07510 [bacterium]|nr:hypothetical protein [FCB group bacterium]MBL7191528.1 hypothetical protein [bacterium]